MASPRPHPTLPIAAALALAAMGLLLSLVGAPGRGEAATLADVYTVTGVPVDATADNAQQARERAVTAGQLRAARLLLERLALRADHPRLPTIDAKALPDLVSGFQVANERNSAVRYLADLTVSFKPEAVRRLMQQAAIPIAETPSQPVLVLPVWREGSTVQLFDDRNPWREAWLKVAAGKGLVPLLTPLGDLADLQAITAEQAVAGNKEALAAIAQRYGTQSVLVAFATAGAGADTIEQLIVVRYTLGLEQGLRIPVTPRRPPEALLATAIAISQEVEENWKAAAAIDSGPGGALDAVAPVAQLSEWIALRKQLAAVPAIKRIDVRSIGVGAAQVTLHHAGTPQQLRAVLAQSGIALTEESGGWTLRAAAPRQP